MPYGLKIILWALAGQTREGYLAPGQSFQFPEGSLSFRNCNPGNLKKGSYTYGLGAVGVSQNNFLVFPDYVTGFLAFCQFLTNACEGKYPLYNPKGTLIDFYKMYAPSSDANDPYAYAEFVSSHAGLSLADPIENFLT